MPYGIIFRTPRGVFLYADSQSVLVAERPGLLKEKALRNIENLRFRDASYMTSIMFDWLTFKPMEVLLPEDPSAIAKMVVVDNEGFIALYSISASHGSKTGYLLKPEVAKELIKNGVDIYMTR